MNAVDLNQALARLGLTPAPGDEVRLLAYVDLLLKWNKTYNLTAIRDREQVISHHLLDSLAILPWIEATPLLDVGSGGGLPGIPLAILRPDLSVTLVDAVQKKVSFLQQAIIELGLSNVHAIHARVETLTDRFGQIVSRAFADTAEFVHLTRHLLAAEGRWLAMKGVRPDDELARLPADIELADIQPLAVPGLNAERHLLILKAVA